jgi:Tol biopolymer transport system component
MERTRLQIFLILIAILPFKLISQNNDADWKYLGQKPPKLKPEVFAPGIISGKGKLHCFPSFSPDGKEIIWMTLPPKLFYMKFDGKWSSPQQVPLLNIYGCLFPIYSYDGKRLYFASNIIPNGFGGADIWYIEKTNTGRSEPINIGPPINTDRTEIQQVLTETGTIYYTGYLQGKRFSSGIYRSKFENEKYCEPEALKPPINIIDTNIVDFTPFIARDESFLLFSSNRQNKYEDNCRIYLSFRDVDGNWSKPINLNEIMDFNNDSRNPYVSPDGKYMLFCSSENIYWVDSQIIAILKKLNNIVKK